MIFTDSFFVERVQKTFFIVVVDGNTSNQQDAMHLEWKEAIFCKSELEQHLSFQKETARISYLG